MSSRPRRATPRRRQRRLNAVRALWDPTYEEQADGGTWLGDVYPDLGAADHPVAEVVGLGVSGHQDRHHGVQLRRLRHGQRHPYPGRRPRRLRPGGPRRRHAVADRDAHARHRGRQRLRHLPQLRRRRLQVRRHLGAVPQRGRRAERPGPARRVLGEARDDGALTTVVINKTGTELTSPLDRLRLQRRRSGRGVPVHGRQHRSRPTSRWARRAPSRRRTRPTRSPSW